MHLMILVTINGLKKIYNMKKQEYLNLPRKYTIREDTPKEFYYREGLPYVSYSQHTSFNETGEFYYQMVLQYIFGLKIDSRFKAYSNFGSDTGDYVNPYDKDKNGLLNDKDRDILNNFMKDIPEDCEYEREVWIERDGFFILGYSDIFYQDKGDGVEIVDLKTGSIIKKEKHYASEDYGQTNLYAYYEDTVKENKIKDCRVVLFDREGNAMKDIPDELHLTGLIKHIPTTYSRKRAEKVLKGMDKTAKDLSSLKDTYDKLSTLTFTI